MAAHVGLHRQMTRTMADALGLTGDKLTGMDIETGETWQIDIVPAPEDCMSSGMSNVVTSSQSEQE